MLELNISNIGRAATKRSYGYFSLRVLGSPNVKVDNKNFIRSRDIVALKTGGPALSENNIFKLSQPAIACSKLTIETLEQGVKYVQS